MVVQLFQILYEEIYANKSRLRLQRESPTPRRAAARTVRTPRASPARGIPAAAMLTLLVPPTLPASSVDPPAPAARLP